MPSASWGNGDFLDFLARRYEHDAICNDVSQPVKCKLHLLRIVIVCSPSPFLRLSTKALCSFSARERSIFYFTPFLPDSELVRFAGAGLSLLGH